MLQPKQKQQLKKYVVFALMFAVFGVSLWLIFKPSGKSSEDKGNGLNTELPMPKESNLIKNKISAYEQEQLFEKKPVRSLEQFSEMVGKDEPKKFDLSSTRQQD